MPRSGYHTQTQAQALQPEGAGAGRGGKRRKVLDETSKDEGDAFKKLWGGWSQKGKEIVASAGFYIMIKIRRRLGFRLDALLFLVEKKRDNEGDETNLARLVDGGANEIEDPWKCCG